MVIAKSTDCIVTEISLKFTIIIKIPNLHMHTVITISGILVKYLVMSGVDKTGLIPMSAKMEFK